MLFRRIAIAAFVLLLGCGGPTASGQGGEATTIEAYYAGKLVTASYRELPPGEDPAKGAVSLLYQSDPGTVGGRPFVSILGSEGGVLHPAWREVQVSGNQCPPDEVCAVPRQFTSAEQLLAAAGTHEIHLVATATRCSMLGVRLMDANTAIGLETRTPLAR